MDIVRRVGGGTIFQHGLGPLVLSMLLRYWIAALQDIKFVLEVCLQLGEIGDGAAV